MKVITASHIGKKIEDAWRDLNIQPGEKVNQRLEKKYLSLTRERWVRLEDAQLYEIMFKDHQKFTEWIVENHPEILKEWARSFGKEISIGGVS